MFSSLKGALIGSHKGSCRMYSTDGMVSVLSGSSLHIYSYAQHETLLIILISIDDSDCKLTQLEQITIQNRNKNKKKANIKKITGFQVTLPITF